MSAACQEDGRTKLIPCPILTRWQPGEERRQRDRAAGYDDADIVVMAASLRVVYSLRT